MLLHVNTSTHAQRIHIAMHCIASYGIAWHHITSHRIKIPKITEALNILSCKWTIWIGLSQQNDQCWTFANVEWRQWTCKELIYFTKIILIYYCTIYLCMKYRLNGSIMPCCCPYRYFKFKLKISWKYRTR